jgi:hypothetical protein
MFRNARTYGATMRCFRHGGCERVSDKVRGGRDFATQDGPTARRMFFTPCLMHTVTTTMPADIHSIARPTWSVNGVCCLTGQSKSQTSSADGWATEGGPAADNHNAVAGEAPGSCNQVAASRACETDGGRAVAGRPREMCRVANGRRPPISGGVQSVRWTRRWAPH